MKFYGMDVAGERERAADEDGAPVDTIVLLAPADIDWRICKMLRQGKSKG